MARRRQDYPTSTRKWLYLTSSKRPFDVVRQFGPCGNHAYA